MIAESFKHKVNGLSERCALSPPSVVTEKGYRVHRQESEAGIGIVHSLSVTFTFDGAPISRTAKVADSSLLN